MIPDNKDTFNYQKALDFLNLKEKTERNRNAELFVQAKKDFDSIIRVIVKYNPQRIYQWGSLLQPEQFDVNSDIDIAVEGIDSVEKFYKLFGEASAITDFSLDLVEIEKISKVHQKAIREKGKLVYEK